MIFLIRADPPGPHCVSCFSSKSHLPRLNTLLLFSLKVFSTHTRYVKKAFSPSNMFQVIGQLRMVVFLQCQVLFHSIHFFN